jgi:hypothetical protein
LFHRKDIDKEIADIDEDEIRDLPDQLPALPGKRGGQV